MEHISSIGKEMKFKMTIEGMLYWIECNKKSYADKMDESIMIWYTRKVAHLAFIRLAEKELNITLE